MQKEEIIKILKSCHNIVLTGAPGTGKTYLARQIAAQMILGKDVIDFDALTENEIASLKERISFAPIGFFSPCF